MFSIEVLKDRILIIINNKYGKIIIFEQNIWFIILENLFKYVVLFYRLLQWEKSF